MVNRILVLTSLHLLLTVVKGVFVPTSCISHQHGEGSISAHLFEFVTNSGEGYISAHLFTFLTNCGDGSISASILAFFTNCGKGSICALFTFLTNSVKGSISVLLTFPNSSEESISARIFIVHFSLTVVKWVLVPISLHFLLTVEGSISAHLFAFLTNSSEGSTVLFNSVYFYWF